MLVATMARTSTRFKPMVKPMILPSAPMPWCVLGSTLLLKLRWLTERLTSKPSGNK